MMHPTGSMIEFREIPGFPEYLAASTGHIWSKSRLDCLGRTWGGYWLKGKPARSGHLRVGLYRRGKQVWRYIHRLVLESFAGSCPLGHETCHNNNDPTDNRVENLRWDTHLENFKDSVRAGTNKLGRMLGESHPRHKLCEREVHQIRQLVTEGVSQQTIARKVWG